VESKRERRLRACRVVVVAIAWGVSGCGGAAAPDARSSTRAVEPTSGGSAPTAGTSAPAVQGPWEHPTSGAVFATEYGTYLRSSLGCYDEATTDCAAHYDSKQGGRLSVFV
jgi:hypothetical protein